MKNRDVIAFELGYDIARYGQALPCENVQPLVEGYKAGKLKYKHSFQPPNRYVKKWIQLRKSALKRHIYFDTDQVDSDYIEYISVSRCPISNIVMTRGLTTDTDLSIDRLCNEYGYVPGNIIAMSVRVNAAKADLTISEISKIADRKESLAGLTPGQWRLIANYQQIAADSFSGQTHLFLSGQRFIAGLNYGLPAHIQAAILHIAAVGYNPDATKADKNEELTALFSMLYQMSTRKTCKDTLLKLIKSVIRLDAFNQPIPNWEIWGMTAPHRRFKAWWDTLLEYDRNRISNKFIEHGLLYDTQNPMSRAAYKRFAVQERGIEVNID